jgi:cAMP-dependent protein kinase regulator
MPRTASVIAISDGHLWALHRAAFRQVLAQNQGFRKDLKKALGEIPYFKNLDSDAINKLATIMDEVTFGRGENITTQGKRGEYMYVVSSGQCYGVQMLHKETKRVNYKAGNFFGDEIFDKGTYGSTVVSLHTTVCWQLDHEIMKQTMGPLLEQG